MIVAFWIFFVLTVLFAFVLLFGAPYLPTQRRQTQAALDLINLKPGQTLYELGCGDGRVLKQAAARGIHGVGYELNPLVALIARIHTWKYRKTVKIVCGNFWRADVGGADAVFVFLLDRFMPKLDKKLTQELKKGTPLVSFAFKIPSKEIARQKDGVYLYQY